MASGRILLSILRSASKCPISTTNPMLSTPCLSSTPASSAYGYLVNRTSEFATSVKPPPSESNGKKVGDRAIVDEFPAKGSTGQVCRLNGNVVDVRLEEGLPQIGTKLDNSSRADLEVVDHLGESTVRSCSVDGTEGPLIGERLLNMDFPISQSILKTARRLDEIYFDPMNDIDEISWDEVIKPKKTIRDKEFWEWNDFLYEGSMAQKWEQRHRKKYFRKMKLAEKKILQREMVLGNGSIGMVCRLACEEVDVRFDKKIEFGGTSYLEVLPTTTLAPLLLEVCDLLGDNIVRAIATNGTEGLVVGDRVFGFPTSNLEQIDRLKREVASLQKKLRFMKQKEKRGRNTGELEAKQV